MKNSGIIVSCPAGKFVVSSECSELQLPLELQITYAILLKLSLKYGYAWPSQEWLAEQVQRSVRTVRNYVAKLRRLGLITVRRRGWGYTSLYYVLSPDDALRALAEFERDNPIKFHREPPMPAGLRQHIENIKGQMGQDEATSEAESNVSADPAAASTERSSNEAQDAVQNDAAQNDAPEAVVYNSDDAFLSPEGCLTEEANVSGQITLYTKSRLNYSPLTPQPSTLPSTVRSNAPQTSFSPQNETTPDCGRLSGRHYGGKPSGELTILFTRLWDVWPVKQARKQAFRTFCRLHRTGKLPSLTHLLACIQRLRDDDSRWRRGMVPLLASWLSGERWNDVPFTGSSTPRENENNASQSAEERAEYQLALLKTAVFTGGKDSCGDRITQAILSAKGGMSALRSQIQQTRSWLHDDHGFVSEYLTMAQRKALGEALA